MTPGDFIEGVSSISVGKGGSHKEVSVETHFCIVEAFPLLECKWTSAARLIVVVFLLVVLHSTPIKGLLESASE